MDQPPLGLSMATAGIIVFVVSAIVLLALPSLFLWMLWHTNCERRRWSQEARCEMGQTLKLERKEQAGLIREREARRQERRQESERGPRERGDHDGAAAAAASRRRHPQNARGYWQQRGVAGRF